MFFRAHGGLFCFFRRNAYFNKFAARRVSVKNRLCTVKTKGKVTLRGGSFDAKSTQKRRNPWFRTSLFCVNKQACEVHRSTMRRGSRHPVATAYTPALWPGRPYAKRIVIPATEPESPRSRSLCEAVLLYAKSTQKRRNQWFRSSFFGVNRQAPKFTAPRCGAVHITR